MIKLCGYLEPCFENGEQEWGHLGNVLCLYLGENADKENGNYSVCRHTSRVQHLNLYKIFFM